MRNHPAPTRKGHQRFCEVEGWVKVTNTRGKTGDHHRYELALPNGEIIRTRISHPPNRDTYGRAMWSHILRDQLHVTEDEFWACVNDGTVPDRGRPATPKSAIPAAIVAKLISSGVPETEVAAMTKDQAIERANAFWSEEG